MLISTHTMAEKRRYGMTMKRASIAYDRLYRVDLEYEQAMPLPHHPITTRFQSIFLPK
ncbi:MAG: hypothetical protein K2I25_03985 [Muribaculaceae bacterium]|nr:hypothetical protein [Muribaculaceae bacterium]